MMATDLLDRIPTEILLEVLRHLKLADLATCKQACQRLCEVADYILSVRYAEELENEGFEDSGGPLANEEKLRRLEVYKHFWKTAEGDLVETFTIPSRASLENIPGALSTTVLAEASTGYEITLRQIPSRIFGVPPRHWTLGPFPFRILALAIDQAQELLIAASYPTTEDPYITLHFLHSETGKEHPRVSVPSIKFPVLRYAYEDQHVLCNIVIYRHMAAITFGATAGDWFSGGLWVMNWNSAELLIDVRGYVSRGLAFVDGRYIIVYSCVTGCEGPVLLVFDVLHPPPLQLHLRDLDMNLPRPLVVLHLPAPPDGHEMIYRDDTIWTCDDHAYPKSTFPPFTRTTGEDIVVVHIDFMCNTPDGCFPGLPYTCKYCHGRTMWIAISKQSLLDIIENASTTPLPPSANQNLRLVPWRTWGIGARIVETDGWEPHPPVHGSRLFTEARDSCIVARKNDCTAIHDFRIAPLRRDPTLAYETTEEDIVDGVVQRIPYRRTVHPPSCRIGEVDVTLWSVEMIGAYFMIVPKSRSSQSPRDQATYHILSV